MVLLNQIAAAVLGRGSSIAQFLFVMLYSFIVR